METWVLGVAMAVLTVALATLLWLKSRSGGDRGGEARPRGRPVPQAPVVAGQRARRMNRRPPAAAAQRRAADADVDDEDDDREEDGEGGSSDESEDGGAKKLEGKMGKKKLEKMQLKAEKKAAREADEREREETKKRRQKEDEDDKKRRDREEEEEKKKEEEERQKREEKERREHEEYLKMKEAFSVEEEGCQEEDVTDQESALKQFIDYIKATKVVVLEDLAAHFRMKTQDVIDRVTTLQQEGELSGVIDDRGKFIFISQSELEAVARFIRQRGRVSIAELAECSNSLINLKPEVPA